MSGSVSFLSHYAPIGPLASYCPWNADSKFFRAHHAIEGHTLADVYRCYELWTLVSQCRHLEGCLIEVSVWRGGTAGIIGLAALDADINAPLYLCDTFSGVPKAGSRDTLYRGGEHADTNPQVVDQLMARLGLSRARILRGVFPDQTGHLVTEDRCRFCHVDVDVYESARGVTEWVWPRLVPGGVLVFDDYGFQGCEGVTSCVHEFATGKDRLMIYNLNGHAIFVKRG